MLLKCTGPMCKISFATERPSWGKTERRRVLLRDERELDIKSRGLPCERALEPARRKVIPLLLTVQFAHWETKMTKAVSLIRIRLLPGEGGPGYYRKQKTSCGDSPRY